MSLMKSNGFLTAAVLLAVGSNANLFGQQYAAPTTDGLARVTDGRNRQAVRPNANPRIQQVSAMQVNGTAPLVPQPANVPAAMPSASCPNGNCQFDSGYGQGNYGQGVCPSCQGRGCGNCQGRLFGPHNCKHSPDYGYSPPAKYPLQRRGVEYTTYYPAKWYGAGGDYIPSSAPMVYQPTDTTQLGFYYQHVPFWQPQPNMIPARPIPAQWHINAPAVEASAFCRNGNCQQGYGNGWDGYNGYQNVTGRRTLLGYLQGHGNGYGYGYGNDQGYYQSEWYPANMTTAPTQQTPQPVPVNNPTPNAPGEVVPQYNTPPAGSAPRPITTDPSAMVPLVPGPMSQVSAPATQISASAVQTAGQATQAAIPAAAVTAQIPRNSVPPLPLPSQPLAAIQTPSPSPAPAPAPPVLPTSTPATVSATNNVPATIPTATTAPAPAQLSPSGLPRYKLTPIGATDKTRY